jgi:ubiquinone/menaquinone biosynthesis C-methylase UbiE
MTSLSSFYSAFFSLKSFLSYEPERFYAQEGYMKGLGFGSNLDFTGKTVLELGAGAGRLTLSMARHGILQTAQRYIVVEPSEGILQIRARLAEPNVSFVKAAFDELGKHIKPHSVDYFIASGVIPHLGASLDHIIGRIEKFVAPEGRLHIVSSYHAFDRKMSRAWKRRCIDHPGWAPTCAAATTLLQSVVPLFG